MHPVGKRCCRVRVVSFLWLGRLGNPSAIQVTKPAGYYADFCWTVIVAGHTIQGSVNAQLVMRVGSR